MEFLVTSGSGLVLGHVIRQWLQRGPDYRVTSVDPYPADARFSRLVEPHVVLAGTSVTQRDLSETRLSELAPTSCIHGAVCRQSGIYGPLGRRAPIPIAEALANYGAWERPAVCG